MVPPLKKQLDALLAEAAHRRRSCSDKIRLWDRRAAIGRARIEERRYGVPTTFYACPFCDGWHLTTRRRR